MNTYHSREREVTLISKTVLLNQLRPNVKWPLILNQYVLLYCHCCCTVLIELTTCCNVEFERKWRQFAATLSEGVRLCNQYNHSTKLK